jgi:hypothetical protein
VWLVLGRGAAARRERVLHRGEGIVGEDWRVGGLLGVDPAGFVVPAHPGGMAERDVVDVEQHLVLALAVPDLPALLGLARPAYPNFRASAALESVPRRGRHQAWCSHARIVRSLRAPVGSNSPVTRRSRKVSRRTQRRQAERKQRECLFCGTEGPLTEQHVFDDWLNQLGFGSDGLRELVEVAEPEDRILQPGAPFNRRLRNVCASCNSEWLSRMEKAAKPLLLDLFRASSQVALDEASQLILARWAFKIACMLSQLGRRRTFPLSHCREFRESNNPPGDCQIRIGAASVVRADLGDQLVESQYQPRIAEIRAGKNTFKVSAYACRFRLLNVVFEVLGWVPNEYGLHIEPSEALGKAILRIWPPEHATIWWPPAVNLDVLGGIQGLSSVEFTGIPTIIS